MLFRSRLVSRERRKTPPVATPGLSYVEMLEKMAEEGKASTTELHSIVSSRKFAAGVHPKVGRRMAEIVLENLGIFSDKQQKHLKSDEWFLGNTFGNNQGKGGDVDGDDQDHVHDERSHSQDKSGEDDCKVRKASEEHRGRDGGSGRRAREPEPEGWVEAPDAGRRDDRARQEALLAEDAKRKALAQQIADSPTPEIGRAHV